MLGVDVRTRSISAPGLRLLLLMIFFLMALTADTRIASAAPGGAGLDVAPPPGAGGRPFDHQGMWIWYVDRSNGGSVPSILAQAKAAGTVYPIGQTYGGASRTDILRFRRFAASYGGLAPSWWDWQETSPGSWSALGATIPGPVAGYSPLDSHPLLKRGSRGDLVVWAQEHLQAAGQSQLPVTGIFGRQTRAAVRAFQAGKGLRVDGAIGTDTWGSLLDFDPVRPRWAGRRAKRGAGAMASRALPSRRPLSASLPAKADEIDPGPAP